MDEMPELLRFSIKGSASKPYDIVAEGSGASLRIFCGCPAGRKRADFCKHISAILMGDVTKLVAGIENIDELKRRAEGSPLTGKAIVYEPASSRRIVGVSTVQEVFDYAKEHLAQRPDFVCTEEGETRQIAIRARHKKTGALIKATAVSLDYNEFTWTAVGGDDGEILREDYRPSVKPWCLRIKTATTKNYSDAGAALFHFMEAVRALP